MQEKGGDIEQFLGQLAKEFGGGAFVDVAYMCVVARKPNLANREVVQL